MSPSSTVEISPNITYSRELLRPSSDALISLWFFFSSRRRHTSSTRDWSSDVCSSDLHRARLGERERFSARSFLVDHRRDLVVRRDGEKLGLELVAGADVDGVDAVREPGLLEHDVDLVAVRGRPGIEVDHGLPLFILWNDYGARNLIVPALLAPIERNPQEPQVKRQS